MRTATISETSMKGRIGNGIATTILREEATRRRITVSLGKPRKVGDGDWACQYRIRRLGRSETSEAHGFDAVQALVLALESVRIALDRSGRRFSCLGGEPGDTGFPRYVPSAFGPKFAKRLGRLIDREVKRFALSAEKQHRARRSAELPRRGGSFWKSTARARRWGPGQTGPSPKAQTRAAAPPGDRHGILSAPRRGRGMSGR